MSEQNKAADRRYVEEVLNQGNLAVIDELRTDDVEGVRNRVRRFRTAFPDLHVGLLGPPTKFTTLSIRPGAHPGIEQR
jgi:hypothetical protein